MPHKPETPNGELNPGTFAGVGLQFAVAIVLFVLLGQWADRKFDTRPVFLMLGVFVGGGAAFYNLYRRITAAQKADDERRMRERSGDNK
jgi:F0F1-type ATP synthase assembly protein I